MKSNQDRKKQVRVMNRADLIRTPPELATEAAPQDWSIPPLYFEGEQPDFSGLHAENLAPGLWAVEAPKGLVRHLPGATVGQLDSRDLSTSFEHVTHGEALHPRWLDKTYLPQVISTVTRRSAIRSGRQLIPLSFRMEWPEIAVNAYPWCTVGRVDFSNGRSGSGVLVGRSIVLTCSHGVPWDQRPWWIKFTPAMFDDHEKFGNSYVSEYWGYRTDPSETSAWDYVVCRLYTSLGDRCGYMGYHGSTDDGFYLNNDTWITVGYPGTMRPQTEFLIDIDDVDDDGDASELETPWDSMPGWSGGPLFGWINGDPKVIGVVSGNEIDSLGGWISDSDHGVFAGGLAMARLISWARANWP